MCCCCCIWTTNLFCAAQLFLFVGGKLPQNQITTQHCTLRVASTSHSIQQRKHCIRKSTKDICLYSCQWLEMHRGMKPTRLEWMLAVKLKVNKPAVVSIIWRSDKFDCHQTQNKLWSLSLYHTKRRKKRNERKNCCIPCKNLQTSNYRWTWSHYTKLFSSIRILLNSFTFPPANFFLLMQWKKGERTLLFTLKDASDKSIRS